MSFGARGGAFGWRVTSWKVADSIPDEHNASGHTMALGSLNLYEKWESGVFPGGRGVKAAGASDLQPYHIHLQIVLKSRSLKILEPSRACPGLYMNCFTFTYVLWAACITPCVYKTNTNTHSHSAAKVWAKNHCIFSVCCPDGGSVRPFLSSETQISQHLLEQRLPMGPYPSLGWYMNKYGALA